MNLAEIQRYISTGKFFDILAVDITLHFIIGTSFIIFCLKKGVSYWKTMAMISSLALGKELFDYWMVMTAPLWEYFSDFFSSIAYGLFLWPWQKWVARKRRKDPSRIKIQD